MAHQPGKMTITEIQEVIISDFQVFDNWVDKHSFLIKLGRDLAPIDSRYQTNEYLIKGCQVKTWFYSEFRDGRIFYDIDSSSVVIRGIIFLLTKILSAQKPTDIKDVELYFIDKIGISEYFSPIRANSLWKIVNRIKADAALRIAKSE